MNDENVNSGNGGAFTPSSDIPSETPNNPIKKGLNENQLPDFQFTPPPPPPPPKTDE
jgi:hypothetical protein